MQFSVNFNGNLAKNEDEKERIHETGQYRGTFFNTYRYTGSPDKSTDGTMDFTELYLTQFSQFLADEPRAAAGEATSITIIA